MLHLPVHPPCETPLPSRSDPTLSSGLWLVTVTVHPHWFVINHGALPKHPALAKRRARCASNSSSGTVTAPASPWPVSCSGRVGFLWVQPPPRRRSQRLRLSTHTVSRM